LALLGLLEREPGHGYDLKRSYDTYFGRRRPLPFGQVCATLARLARDGKVVPGKVEQGAGSDRKRYAITDVGKREVETWLTEPIEPEAHLQTVLFVKVVLALMLGRSAERYLDTQRVTAGVNDWKRPFSLLRLAGAPIRVLRRVVALEAAVPLFAVAALAAGLGFAAAALFLRSQLDETLRSPGLEYYVIVIAGLVASLGIIASTLPLIERITGPEVARNE